MRLVSLLFIGAFLACTPVTVSRSASNERALLQPASEAPTLAGPGTTEGREFMSAALGRAMPYWIHLPPGYEKTARAYPVVYLLHGIGGSLDEWKSLGVFDVADELFDSGKLAPFIIVLPQGDRGYWMDHADGGPAYGRYTAVDLVREIDSHFRTEENASGRAIGGLSMGAHGAVQLAINHPETFAAAGAHSIALRRESTAFSFFGTGADYAARDPMTLAKAHPADTRSLVLWIDIGSSDPWAPLAEQFNAELTQLGIEHTWHEWSGDHSATYWSAHLVDYLSYYGAAFGTCAARRAVRAEAGPR